MLICEKNWAQWGERSSFCSLPNMNAIKINLMNKNETRHKVNRTRVTNCKAISNRMWFVSSSFSLNCHKLCQLPTSSVSVAERCKFSPMGKFKNHCLVKLQYGGPHYWRTCWAVGPSRAGKVFGFPSHSHLNFPHRNQWTASIVLVAHSVTMMCGIFLAFPCIIIFKCNAVFFPKGINGRRLFTWEEINRCSRDSTETRAKLASGDSSK